MSDALKSRYPFLACWKKDGLGRFPKIPFEFFLDGVRKAVREELEKRLRQLLRQLEKPPSTFETKVIESWFEKAMESTVDATGETIVEAYIHEAFQMGVFAMEARQLIISGEDRERVLRELGNKIFPKTKGGGSIFTKEQKETLKRIHLDLQECIKEIRRSLDIPLLDSPYDSTAWGEDKSEDIEEHFPDIFEIFSANELALITKTASISEVSLDIIQKRLTKTLRHKISTRTLRNTLEKVHPVRQ